MIRAFELSVPATRRWLSRKRACASPGTIAQQPSIDAPVALFFGAGILYNRDDREYLVKAFPSVIQYQGDRVHLRSYFPMPFFRDATIELGARRRRRTDDVRFAVRHAPFTDPPNHVGYFHATYRDHPRPRSVRTWCCSTPRRRRAAATGRAASSAPPTPSPTTPCSTRSRAIRASSSTTAKRRRRKGPAARSGAAAATTGAVAPCRCRSPAIRSARRAPEQAKDAFDRIHSAYRFLLADLMPFGRNAVIRLEHGATNLSTEHYETVTYWYGIPAPSLVRTDELDVGDAASERAHAYVSPDASEPYELVSRYEWGVDTLERTLDQPPFSGEGREVYPAHAEVGRHTRGASEFTLRTDPRNLGVMLRRQLDYSLPDQRANVFVAADADAATPDWQPAGVWYLAGSNTVVYSYPPDRDELGATLHQVETSNRRFRDDEFLLPRRLTEGKSRVRVRDRVHAGRAAALPSARLAATAVHGVERDALHRVQLRAARLRAVVEENSYIQGLPSGREPIVGVPTSVTAFVGRAWRGPVDEPVTISNYADYERQFGGLWRDSAMSYAVQHFFANGGGRAVIVRVMTRTDTGGTDPAAWATLDLGGGNTLAAAYPGTWGRNLKAWVDHDTTDQHDPSATPDDKLFNLTLLDDPEPVTGMSRGGSGQREVFEKVSLDAASPRFVSTVLEQQSQLARVTALDAARPAATPIEARSSHPRRRERRRLVGGFRRRGRERPEDRDSRTLEDRHFNLLCLPPLESGAGGAEVSMSTWAAAARSAPSAAPS